MSEIDKFCMFVNTTNGLCRSPINTNDKYCDEIPIERCYYKQLQQLKAENEGLQSLNDFNIQKIEILQAENEKLKQDLQKESDLGHKAICEEMDSFFEVMKLQKCLDEIEGICQNETINLTDSCVNGGRYFEILQLIKQAKEGK